MKRDLAKSVREYKKRHPEFDEIMKKFQMSQEAYYRALASMGGKARRTAATYTLTTQGRYNVNISTAY